MKKLLLTSLVCASTLFAQNNYQYEITPMIGGTYTEGNLDLDRNYANIGLSIAENLDDSIFDQVELGFLRSIEDVDYDGNNGNTGITRVFTNIIKEYELSSKSSFYALVGAGIEIFDDEKLGNEDGLFGNYGVGYKYKLDNDLSLKFDVRHLIETDHGDNNLLYTMGLAIPFGEKGVQKAPVAPMAIKEVDTDRDGVVDSADKCPNSPIGSKVDTNGCAIMVDLSINFDTNSAVIKPQYNKRIEAFANYLNDNTDVKATIEAHTDSRGSEKYNQKLSEKRAISTVNALEKMKIDSSRLTPKGYGETKPAATNTTKEGMAKNRRVEAIINR